MSVPAVNQKLGFASFAPTPAPSRGTPTHRLGANESPYPPAEGVLEAIAAAAASVHRYPDLQSAGLVAELSEAYGVPEDWIAVGAGSGQLLQALFQAAAGPGAEAVFAWRSFEIYPMLADLAGVRAVRVPLLADVHDVPAMIERINARTRLVIVCQPNNPTGTVLSADAINRLVASVPSDCLVAVDEAYFEYVRDPQAADGIALARRWPNLVVLRTFSKAYSLAGLRVGYAIGDPGVVARLRAQCLPFSLNAPAQAAAIAALRLRGPLMERVDWIVAERDRVRKALIAEGWQVPRSEANFLWLGLGESTAAFAQWCAEQGIAVRGFPGGGVRVSLGTPVDNDAFLTACAGWLARAQAPGLVP